MYPHLYIILCTCCREGERLFQPKDEVIEPSHIADVNFWHSRPDPKAPKLASPGSGARRRRSGASSAAAAGQEAGSGRRITAPLLTAPHASFIPYSPHCVLPHSPHKPHYPPPLTVLHMVHVGAAASKRPRTLAAVRKEDVDLTEVRGDVRESGNIGYIIHYHYTVPLV